MTALWALQDIAQVIDCEHRTAPVAKGEPAGFSLGTRSIRDGRIRWDQAKPVSAETLDAWTGRAVPQVGDLILSREAPMGEVALVPAQPAVCLGQRTVLLRPTASDVESKYLLYRIMAPQMQGWIRANALGSTVLHINVADVRRMPVGPLPSLTEQRRIVDLLEDHLSRLDAAEAGLRVALDRSEALLTAGLWNATHGLDATNTVQLQEIAEVRLGRQRSPKNHHGDRMRPYLRAANVGWDELRLDDVKTMQFTQAEERTYRLELGDILLTEASGSPAEVGKSAIYRGLPAEVCFQNTLLRVRCHSAEPEFVQKYLLAEARAGRFMPESRGVGINHLGRARLAALSVELPTQELQAHAIATSRALIDHVEGIQAAVGVQQRRSAQLRRSVLAAAFEGQLTGRRTDLEVIEELAHA